MGEKVTAGVIGLGAMGMGVAQSLVRAGVETYACDVRAEVVDAFAQAGGKAAASPAEMVKSANVIVVMVVNAEQTDAVLFGENGAVANMAPGSVVIASSTVAPPYARDLGARLADKGILMIDAPVSGGAAKAATGELSIMASGPGAAFEMAAEILDAIAAKVYRLGEEAGQGSSVKMINQLLAGVHIAAASEAMALGIGAGIDPDTLYEVITNSAGSSWMFQNRVPHILEGDYTPKSAVDIFVKDLGIVLETGKGMAFPLPLSAAAHQQFLAAKGMGLGREDDSAVVKVYQALTGIELPKKK